MNKKADFNNTPGCSLQGKGFILTRHARDIANGIEITLWIKSASGAKKIIVEGERAIFFVPQAKANAANAHLTHAGIRVDESKALALKTFEQQPVTGFYFTYLKSFYRARQILKQQGISCYEDDFRPEERFLMERFITAELEYQGIEKREKGFSLVTQAKCRAITHRLASSVAKKQKAPICDPLVVSVQSDPTSDLQSPKSKSSNINNANVQDSYTQASHSQTSHSQGNPVHTSNIHLKMLSIDIECSANGDLYSIGFYGEGFKKQLPALPADPLIIKKVFMVNKESSSNTQQQAPHLKERLTPDSASLGHCNSEVNEYLEYVANESALLMAMLAFIKDYDPDIFIGWNVVNFDFALLQERFDLYNIPFSVSRDSRPPYWRENNNGQKFISIAGRVVLDGIDLLKSATYNFSSFSLDNVAHELLGKGKKIDDVENRLVQITHDFLHNKPALAAYNLEDCRLVWQIFEKTNLLSFAQLRAQLTGLEIDRIGGSVAAFTNLYLPKLHRSGYVAPNLGDGSSGLISPGGYVMDSIPGLYQNILVLDFKSLYPSIIRTFKIDPMGLIEGLLAPNSAIEGFDGAYFSREKHFLPSIIETLWLARDKAKKQTDQALSQAIKIIMNSFYGVLGSNGCRFFDPRLSGSITKRSHQLLKTTKLWIEAKGYTVIYGDTDSIFVHIGDDKTATQAKELGRSLSVFINDKWQNELQEKYQVKSALEIEFETHFSRFFMPTIRGQEIGTKKRYAGVVEKNNQEQLIFKGLESVRTDWTELAKIFQQGLYKRVFNQEPVIDYILDIVEKTQAGQFDQQLVYRKRLRRPLNLYVKNVPPQVKAARLADAKNKVLGKSLKYQNKGTIEYFITLNGPQAKEYLDSPLDYQFYIERQLAAVADAILPFIGTSFEKITGQQLSLFNG